MVSAIQIFISVFKLGDLTRSPFRVGDHRIMTAAATLLSDQWLIALGIHDKGTGAQNVLYRLSLTLTGRSLRFTRRSEYTLSRSYSP